MTSSGMMRAWARVKDDGRWRNERADLELAGLGVITTAKEEAGRLHSPVGDGLLAAVNGGEAELLPERGLLLLVLLLFLLRARLLGLLLGLDVGVDGLEVALGVLLDGVVLAEESAEVLEEVLGELGLLHVVRVKVAREIAGGLLLETKMRNGQGQGFEEGGRRTWRASRVTGLPS